jgi:hypothetical protein
VGKNCCPGNTIYLARPERLSAAAGGPVNGNFTVDQDRDTILSSVENYVKEFRTYHTLFMKKPMLACEIWNDVGQLPSDPWLWNSPQIGVFDSPKQWCEHVLPEGCAGMWQEVKHSLYVELNIYT